MARVFGYGKPTKFKPIWHVPDLVFQGGVPNLPTLGEVGGGIVYTKPRYGTFQPVIVEQLSITTDQAGGGVVPANPPFLTALINTQKSQQPTVTLSIAPASSTNPGSGV